MNNIGFCCCFAYEFLFSFFFLDLCQIRQVFVILVLVQQPATTGNLELINYLPCISDDQKEEKKKLCNEG